MSRIGPTGASESTAGQQSKPAGTVSDPYNNLDSTQFLKLLINELQNQDPLNPMDNSAMVEQIGQIRQITATDSLSTTLSRLSESQELVTASGLIGQTITGLASDSTNVTGKVDRVTVETNDENNSRTVKVHVGEKTMEVKNIREILTE